MPKYTGRLNVKKVVNIFTLSTALSFSYHVYADTDTNTNTYQENLKLGADTSSRNYLNDPFVKPNSNSALNMPETWAIFYNRAPVDRSPKDKSTKVLTIGTGTPAPNPYRFGPAHVLIVNNYPYFVDCGEGWFRAVNRAIMTQKGLDLNSVFKINNIKYMFLTHLHEDHTVGLPSFILSPYKWGSTTNKVIFGPKGTEHLIHSIVDGWTIDRQEMMQGSTHSSPEGSTAVAADIDPSVEFPGPIYEDDNVKVEAFPTSHGALANTFAYRFTAKSDGRVVTFGGDGHYSKGLVDAARGADVLVIEGFSKDDLATAPWGGESLEEKTHEVSAYHLFPNELKVVQQESGVKEIVMTHEQDYATPDKYQRLSLLKEMQKAGVKNIYSSYDGDLY